MDAGEGDPASRMPLIHGSSALGPSAPPAAPLILASGLFVAEREAAV